MHTSGLRTAATFCVYPRAMSSPDGLTSACTSWPCAFCTLQVSHTATVRGGVKAALRLAQAKFREERIDQFQLEMAEAAAMHLMSRSDEFVGFSAGDIRDCVVSNRDAPFSIFGPLRTASSSGAGVRPDLLPPPPSPTSTLAPANSVSCPPPPTPPAASSWLGPDRSASKRVCAARPGRGSAASGAAGTACSDYKWQIKIGKKPKMRWSDCCQELGETLEVAYVLGWDSATWTWGETTYYYELGSTMMQTNPDTDAERPIRRVAREIHV